MCRASGEKSGFRRGGTAVQKNSSALTAEEKTEIKKDLLSFVKRVSHGGFEIQEGEFLALPRIVDILLRLENPGEGFEGDKTRE